MVHVCVAILALKKFYRSIELLRVNAGTSRENSREASNSKVRSIVTIKREIKRELIRGLIRARER